MALGAYHGPTANAPRGRQRAVSSSAPTSNAPPSLATARLPRRTRQALEHLLAEARPVLEQLLPRVLHETELALARTAASSDPVLEQAKLAAMRSLGHGGPVMTRSFLDNVEALLAGLQTARREADAADVAPVLTLSLLEEDVVSDEFLLDTMASRIEARNSLALQLLGQRFGVLAGAPAFDGETLPLAPRALCTALAQSADQLKLSRYARMQLFQQFEKALMEAYPELLEGFNHRLIKDGILPFLSFVPMRVRAGSPGAAPDPASAESRPAEAGAGPPAGWSAFEDAAPPSEAAGFAVLQSLLQQRRSLLSKLRPGSQDERVLEAMSHDEVLATLQRMRASTGKADTLTDFRRILLAQARQAHGRGVALPEADNDSLDLLGLFMGQLQRELRRTSPGEAMLERLRLPLTQLAMRDQAFFTDAAHPARQLVEAISLSGAQWLADDDLDAQWLGLLQRAASHVQQDAGGTPETFAEANRTLQSGLQAMDRKAEMAERRQVEAARGREKLEVARLRADQEIQRLLDGRSLPRFHATLLEQTWTDVLSLTHLRSGEQSDAWRQLLDITASIIDAGAGASTAAQAGDPAFLEQIRAALEQVGYHADDASAIAAQLTQGQGSDADQASRTELLLQLRARARLGEDSNAAAHTAAVARTPAEQAAYERLRSLSLPRWVEIDDDGQDGPQRRRLAWISEHTDQALLVNRRGLRAGNDNLDSLARKLAAGRLRLLEQHVAPAAAAWGATLSSLQRIAPDADAQAKEVDHE